MASRLATIFGTEQDRVNCSFYYKVRDSLAAFLHPGLTSLPPDWSMSTRRPLLTKAHTATLLSDYPPSKRLPQSRSRPKQQTNGEGASGQL